VSVSIDEQCSLPTVSHHALSLVEFEMEGRVKLHYITLKFKVKIHSVALQAETDGS